MLPRRIQTQVVLHVVCMQGFVVGFKGSQVFCLHYNSMQALEVPQSASMQGYLAAEDFESACKVFPMLRQASYPVCVCVAIQPDCPS